MASTTTVSRRTIKRKKAGLPMAGRGSSAAPAGESHARTEIRSSPRSTATRIPAPPRSKKWWQRSEVLFAVAAVALVLSGLTYIGLKAPPNTGYPQDDFANSGGAYGGSGGTNGHPSQNAVSADEGFLAFARAQHARSDASRAANAERARKPARPN